MSQDSSFNFKDYLDEAGDAARRTRTVTIVLVVASVLAFVGFLNTLPDGWIAQRLKTLSRAGLALNKPLDAERECIEAISKKEPDKKEYIEECNKDIKSLEYLEQKIGSRPPRYKNDEDKKNKLETEEYKQYKDQYKELYSAMVKTSVDNTFTTRVPFFGIGFDINYLGLMSGLGFVIILILFRFTITRELHNLKLSFEVAKKRTSLWEFYHLLAMRQVLTIPPMETEKQSKFWAFVESLAFIPKVICLLPLSVYAAVTLNDIRTASQTGEKISESLTKSSLYKGYSFLLLILLLTVACYRKWRQVDRVWKDYWSKAKKEKAFKEDSKSR